MKLKSQLIISIAILGVVFLIILGSFFITNQQATQLNNQEQLARNIQTGVGDLNYLSNDFFLYQQSPQVILFQSKISSLTTDLSKLNPTSPTQAVLVNITNDDLQRLDSVFEDAVSFLENAPRNVSVRVLPAFQTAWSRLAVQSQTLTYDSAQLSQLLRNQADQVKQTNSLLVFAMVGAFGVYFVTIYFTVFRRTFRSITKLQEGTKIIGSGNLDYAIVSKSNDEIGELSQAFNQMTTNLKTVTASKTDLEQEIVGRKRAEIALRESEQRWATTLASIGDAVIATDTTGNIIFMNGEAEELTGWTLSEASQKPVKTIFNIINEQTRLKVENPIDRVLREGVVVGLANHTLLIRKDGAEVSIDDSGAPIRDKDGKTTGVVLVFRDFTERKKAEEALRESEERLRFHAENTPLAVVEWDSNFVVTRWAGDAPKIFGWTASETVGKPIMDLHLIYSPDIPIVEKTMSRLTSGETKVVSANRNITKDGKVIYCVWYNSVLLDEKGKMLSVFSFVEDNTAKVKAEESLEENNKNLEKLVEERTKQLKDSERLAAIGATAGMVGHDIRNPLQAIASDVYLLKTDLASMPDIAEKKGVQESLDGIENNVSYINKIVADLQDFARPLAPKLEEIDLEQTIHFVLANINIPGNVTVKLSIEKDFPKLKLDQSYMQRILTNLSNNAIQAMPNGGKLIITASSKNGKAAITVEDTGEGIPENVRSKLFTPLVTTKSKGQGFGLSVVKRFTVGMGGTVSFESEIGKGTNFKIELPI
jgi:PAS domain S-box-containing protein